MCLSIILQDNKLAKVNFREIVHRVVIIIIIRTCVFMNVVSGNIISGLNIGNLIQSPPCHYLMLYL